MRINLRFLFKGVLIIAFIAFGFVGCESEKLELDEVQSEDAFRVKGGNNGKIDICHYSADDDQWIELSVNEKAWRAHSKHDDVWLDLDGDGYTAYNECGIGSMDDCDDTNADVNPGVEEICDNGIDDNCDGNMDEGCVECLDICYVLSLLCETFEERLNNGRCYIYGPITLTIVDNNNNNLNFQYQSPGDEFYACFVYYESTILASGLPECDDNQMRSSLPNEKSSAEFYITNRQ